MSMKIEHEGKEIEVFTPEEVEAQKQEALKSVQEELDKTKRVISEKNENFKRYKDMTEQEKEMYSAGELEARRLAEAAEARAQALEEQYNKDKKAVFDKAKEGRIARYAGGDEALKKEIEANFELINLEGADEETAKRRVDLAFNMTGKGKINPLTQDYGRGEAPKQKDTTEKFAESDKGKEGMKQIGEIKF